jgi:speckle-type POZ protein
MAYPLPCPPPTAGDGTPSGSASITIAGAARGYHVLKIDGYSRTRHAIPNRNYVDSRPFSVAGLTWAIRYYPNGRNIDSADCISLYLVLMNQVAEDVTVQFLLSFLDEVESSQVRAIPASRFSAQMIVIGKLRAEDTVTSIVVPPRDWPQHFQNLLQSRQGVDVSIVVGDEQHTAVFSRRAHPSSMPRSLA